MKKTNRKKNSALLPIDIDSFGMSNSQPIGDDYCKKTTNKFNYCGKRNPKLPDLVISKSVMQEIENTIGMSRAEQGGPLGGNRNSGVVTDFHFDNSANRTSATYSPNVELLNKLFADEWNPQNINLLGFVHSHPAGSRQPSGGDIIYAANILAAIPKLEYLFLPIVMTTPDTGSFTLLPFVALRDGETVRIEQIKLILRDDEMLKTLPESQENKQNITIEIKSENHDGRYSPAIFERVQNAYDLDHLSDCRIVCIGAGGAADFIENIVRAGVGQIILIDKDVVSESNIATQQTYLRDVGRTKVDCIAGRLMQINPQAAVVALPRWLDDDFGDAEIAELLVGEIEGRKPTRTLLCGLTDNFQTQARINRLALQFGVPSLCAQVYQEGRGAEVTFTYPGFTPACHRCILSSRYQAFLKENFQNEVTSHGTPIFSTTRLNAIKGFITLALLHHGTDHPRWGNFLNRIGNRNLIQIRLDPDFATIFGFEVFNKTFEGADKERLFFDESIWLPQKAESPDNGYDYYCPDCGGKGDLGSVIGTYDDTRIMR